MLPAQIRTAVALALALALVGVGGASLAQPTTAVASHTTYVAMVELFGAPEEERVITGTVACTVNLQQRVLRAVFDVEPCDHDGYAYAYPADAPAPWDGEIKWVNDSYYIDEAGSMWHTAEVVYRAVREAPEGGESLVRAIASEILPNQRTNGGLDANYVLPVDLTKLSTKDQTLVVGLGPDPPVTLAS